MAMILQSVGRGGAANLPSDVQSVQTLLDESIKHLPHPLRADGQMEAKALGAIEAFKGASLRWIRPTAKSSRLARRVDLRALERAASRSALVVPTSARGASMERDLSAAHAAIVTKYLSLPIWTD